MLLKKEVKTKESKDSGFDWQAYQLRRDTIHKKMEDLAQNMTTIEAIVQNKSKVPAIIQGKSDVSNIIQGKSDVSAIVQNNEMNKHISGEDKKDNQNNSGYKRRVLK